MWALLLCIGPSGTEGGSRITRHPRCPRDEGSSFWSFFWLVPALRYWVCAPFVCLLQGEKGEPGVIISPDGTIVAANMKGQKVSAPCWSTVLLVVLPS